MSTPRILIPPPCEPLSLDAARLQLRVDADLRSDDHLIRDAIRAARRHIETTLRRTLVLTTFRTAMDGFPGRGLFENAAFEAGGAGWVGGVYASARAQPNMHLDDPAITVYGGPVQSILSIQYLDTTGALQTLDPATYTADLDNDPARIMPAVGMDWPSTLAQVNAVMITCAAGWMAPVTPDANADTLTLAAGAATLSNGQGVTLITIDGDPPEGIETHALYYVIDAAGSSFKISDTPGGSAIDVGAGATGTLLVDTMPPEIRHALKMLVAFFYENRGETGGGGASIGDAVDALLSPHRVWRF